MPVPIAEIVVPIGMPVDDVLTVMPINRPVVVLTDRTELPELAVAVTALIVRAKLRVAGEKSMLPVSKVGPLIVPG